MNASTRYVVALFSCCLLTFGCGSKIGNTTSQTEVSTPLQPFPSAPLGQTGEGEWELIFHDEFNGNELDRDKWVTCYWWNNDGCTNEGNNNFNWYQPDNVLVQDGKLILRAQHEHITTPAGQEYSYTSGMITSGRAFYRRQAEDPRFTLHHAYVEMRARVPQGRGLWPAFWLLPASHDTTPEIDVMEILGHTPNEVHMNFHYTDRNGNLNRAANTWISPEPLTGWHVFAHDWQPDSLTWYVDGVEHANFNRYVPDEPMYLIANLAVGGDWPGAPDNATPFPSDFEIDYIRVWIRK